MRLHPTVPYMPGETPTSFASRLARCNNITSARELLSDFGLSFGKLVDGDHATITYLAEVAGTDPAPLLRESCRRVGNDFLLRSQILTRASLVRPSLRICPVCIAEDQQSAGGATEGTAAYCRTVWSIQHLRTCAHHDVALVDLPTLWREAAHDFPSVLDGWSARSDAGVRDACRRPASQFERYLIRRLEGGAAQCWLDGLPFYAAARISEMMGLVATQGRRPVSKSLTSDDWAEAGRQGFLVASAGPERIEKFLHDLWADYPGGRSTPAGPKAWFGRFYQWLEYETNDPVYDPVRDIIVRFVADRIPFHENEKLFGKPVPYRKVHSVGTAIHQTGISEKRLRKVLLQAGHIDPGHERCVAHQVTFDATAAAALLDRLATALTTADVAAALGITWDQVKPIVDAGFLRAIDKRESATVASLFSSEDFAAFMSALRDGAVSLTSIPDGAFDLSAACRRAQCTLVNVVGLVIRRELNWVGWLPEASGFRSILVDAAEIRSRVRREELEGYTRRQVEHVTGIPTASINALIKCGLLPATRERHPIAYHKVLLISKEGLDRFRAQYVKLSEAAGILELSIPAARRALDVAGIGPSLPKADFRTAFYLRGDIEAFAVRRCQNWDAADR